MGYVMPQWFILNVMTDRIQVISNSTAPPSKLYFNTYLCLCFNPVQFSADVYNHYEIKQRSLFIAPLVVIYCRELALHHRPQGAT